MDAVKQNLKTGKLFIQNILKHNKYIKWFTVAIGGLIIRYIYNVLYRKYYRLPPGVMGFPLVGSLPYMILDLQYFYEKILGNIGPITTMNVGIKDFVIINDPDYARHIYSASSQSHKTLYKSKCFINNPKDQDFSGINGNEWVKRRKLMQQRLNSISNSKFIQNGVSSFIETTIDPKITTDGNKGILFRRLLRPLFFNLTFYACFGHNIKSLNDPFWVNFNKESKIAMQNSIKIRFFQFVFGSKFVSLMYGNTFRTILRPMVTLLENYVKDKQFKDDDKSVYGSLMKSKSLGKKQILLDVAALLTASTDTAPSAMEFCIYLLCKYPNIQQKLYAECVNINKPKNKTVNLIQLHLTRAFIHETLRLFPIAAITDIREINDDKNEPFILGKEYGNYEFPCGTLMQINVLKCHRTASFWNKNDNIKEIHLEYWLDDNNKFKSNQNFMGFAVGKRNCVAFAIAIRELMFILYSFITKYKFYAKNGKSGDDLIINGKIDIGPMKPADEIHVCVSIR